VTDWPLDRAFALVDIGHPSVEPSLRLAAYDPSEDEGHGRETDCDDY
jgi:hypothetical protein